MQISTGRHAQTPGATWTHAHAIPVGQEYPIAVKEAAEAEVATVLEEIAAHNPLMVKVAAAFDTVSIEIAIPIGAIEQAPVAVLVAEGSRSLKRLKRSRSLLKF
jgi:hypothetical protein